MGASGFAAIGRLLAEEYTVVTYDPRGFARSTIDDPDQDAEPDLLADDARRVLEAVGGEPAHVFGSSGGAVTGLALVAHYPGHVQTLVAHEPPLALLLAEAEEARAGMDDIYDTYRGSGSRAAWQKFSAFSGIDMCPQGEDAAPQPPSPEAMATSERFFRHGLLPIALFQPEFSALQDAPTRVVVAGGTTSKGQFAQRTAVALCRTPRHAADRLPRRPCRLRQRPQGLRRRPPPHPGSPGPPHPSVSHVTHGRVAEVVLRQS